jgi:hypothetical protein
MVVVVVVVVVVLITSELFGPSRRACGVINRPGSLRKPPRRSGVLVTREVFEDRIR